MHPSNYRSHLLLFCVILTISVAKLTSGTWQELKCDFLTQCRGTILNMVFADEQTGILVIKAGDGSYHLVKTENAGISWSEIVVPFNDVPNFANIYIVRGTNQLYLCTNGSEGRSRLSFLRSINFGKTWSQCSIPVDSTGSKEDLWYYFGGPTTDGSIEYFNTDTLVALGGANYYNAPAGRGAIFVSYNNGRDWDRQGLGFSWDNKAILILFQMSLPGDGREGALTYDAYSWGVQTTSVATYYSAALGKAPTFYVNKDYFYLTSPNGYLKKSGNTYLVDSKGLWFGKYGVSDVMWHNLYPVRYPNMTLSSVSFGYNSDVGLAELVSTGEFSTRNWSEFYRSTDAGTSFEYFGVPEPKPRNYQSYGFKQILVVSDNVAYAISDSSIIKTTTLSAPLSDAVEDVADEGALLQPNPANAFIQVRRAGGLELYNMLGRTVAVFPMVSRGESLNLSSIPNGKYFVRLITHAGLFVQSLDVMH